MECFNMNYLDVKGRIFDIQKFSMHDGPGIRTIVFLKGCIFRCQWCCNPESQNFDIEKMIVNGKVKTIGQDVTVREVLEKIEQDRPYYKRSGGGVTLSGGECMCQRLFSKALLHSCKEIGISTAIETTAGVDKEIIKDIVEEVDTVLMDIKHINGEKHKKFTGRDNKIILENANIIANSHSNLIIRVPVIPTFNHTKEEIREIAKFAKGLNGVRKLHLLPYHRMGQDKYTGLNRKYIMEGIDILSNEYMNMLLEVVLEEGLEGQIGG